MKCTVYVTKSMLQKLRSPEGSSSFKKIQDGDNQYPVILEIEDTKVSINTSEEQLRERLIASGLDGEILETTLKNLMSLESGKQTDLPID